MMRSPASDSAADPQPAKLVLADGTVARGVAVGHRGLAGGELCFNTSMTGYQEILTDPSYYGQLMMMTQPHIGNYGASEEDMEARRPMVAGLIVRAFTQQPSNALADETLDAFMRRHELVGIAGVDTRRLVRHIRAKGVMNAVISSETLDEDALVEKAANWPSMEGLELASEVTARRAHDYCQPGETTLGEAGAQIAVYDFGVKQNILRSFARRGCGVRVFPAGTPVEEVLEGKPDGIFLSNGPGDPRAMPAAVETTRAVIESGVPVFGICLGHQLMALAQGFSVYKMFVGHRGANHPVKNLKTGRVEVTTQNHGFAIEAASVDAEQAEVTHVNLNDDTVEGLRFTQFDGLSLQYHPEASPGPHDSDYLFDEFLERVNACRRVQAGEGTAGLARP